MRKIKNIQKLRFKKSVISQLDKSDIKGGKPPITDSCKEWSGCIWCDM